MPSVLPRSAIHALLAALFAGAPPSAAVAVEGGREPPPTKWLAERPFSYSVHGSERTEYRFEWRRDDWDGTRRAKGTELKTKPMTGPRRQQVSFDFWVDADDYVGDSKLAIIMQYHSYPDENLGEGWRNPISSLLIRDGLLQYDYRSSVEQVTPKVGGKYQYSSFKAIKLGAPRWGAWNSIRLEQRFDPSNGLVEILLNGKRVSVDPARIGFNDRRGPFLKFGLYCPGGSDKPQKVIRFRNVMVDGKPLSGSW